jgi:hypothetical protein
MKIMDRGLLVMAFQKGECVPRVVAVRGYPDIGDATETTAVSLRVCYTGDNAFLSGCCAFVFG